MDWKIEPAAIPMTGIGRAKVVRTWARPELPPKRT